jgi:DNA helicase HerA-like ATPase
VSVFPALEDPIFLATPTDLAQVYAPPRVAAVPVGTIHQDGGVPAYLLVDDLLGKHFSIVGTTGSGKIMCRRDDPALRDRPQPARPPDIDRSA